jgi:PAS domain S-box-containing protein
MESMDNKGWITTKKRKLWFLLIFVVIATIIIFSSSLFIKNQANNYRKGIINELNTTTAIKSRQLSDWYADELQDAELIAGNNIFNLKLDIWLNSQSESDRIVVTDFLQNFKKEHNFEAIFLINPHKRLFHASTTNIDFLDELVFQTAISAIEKKQALTTNLYRCQPQNHIHIDFIAPIFIKNQPNLAMVFRISPQEHLYPVLNEWPGSSPSIETILFGISDNNVVYLSQPQNNKDTIFALEEPIENNNLVTAQATSEKSGIIYGTDYHHNKVMASAMKIDNTPWYLLTKIDQAEINRGLRSIILPVIVFTFLFLLLIGASLMFFYSIQQRNFYRTLYKVNQEYKTILYSIGDGVITTDKHGHIKQMNHVAEVLTGWDEKDSIEKPLDKIFNIISEEDHLPVENPFAKVIKNGTIVGLANHTLLVSKSGQTIPIADSGAPVKNEKGEIDGVVLVFRDQTTEREQQNNIAESQRRLMTLLSNLPGMAYRCENNYDWNMQFISSGCYELTGYYASEIENNSFVAYGELIEPIHRQYVYDTVQQALDQKVPFQIEYQVKHRNGYPIWVWEQGRGIYDESMHLVAIEGFISNINERKIAQQEKLQMANALEASINELYMFDTASYQFTYANQSALRSLGITLEEITKLFAFDLLKNMNKEEFQTFLMPLTSETENTLFMEGEHSRKNGEVYPVELHYQLLKQDDKRLCFVVGIDISERKKNENALKQSEKEYRELFENHAAVKLIVNPANGHIMNANKAAEAFYGYSHNELSNMNISQINTLLPNEIKLEMEKARYFQKNHFEFKHKLANGKIRDVEVFSSPIEMNKQPMLHSIIHDITERREAEKKIQLLSRSIEQSPVCVIITDVKGRIEYVNQEFSNVTGYALMEVIGKNPRFLKSGHQSQAFYENLWSTIMAGENWHGELFNKKKNGEHFWESAIIVPIINEKNNTTHFVALKEDITEKKKMFDELIFAKQRAEESERLKTAFLANMSHEIRTPLNSILGFTSFLTGNDDLLPEEKEQYAQIINKSADGLLQIINDILDISRLETGQILLSKKSFDLNNFLGNIYQETLQRRNQIKKNQIKISLTKTDHTVLLIQDEFRLRQILSNLLNNALKFTMTGSISFGILETTPENVEIYVSDTGIGIKEENRSMIFDRFRQLDDTTTKALGGNGLGLSIVKSLIELMNGEIWVESVYGEGTTFKFVIPIN